MTKDLASARSDEGWRFFQKMECVPGLFMTGNTLKHRHQTIEEEVILPCCCGRFFWLLLK